MPHIEWDESFSVNDKEIDGQHKKWIGIINELHENMMSGDVSIASTLNAMEAMKDYVRYHFEYEEDHMRKIGYQGLAEHQALHARFYTMIDQYYNDLRSGKMVLNSEIMKILVNWLQDHIMHIDKKYSEFKA